MAKVNPELFIIPEGDDSILVLPLEGMVAQVNAGVVRLLQTLDSGGVLPAGKVTDYLCKNRFVISDSEIVQAPDPAISPNAPFLPTSVNLFPTSDCNLRCIYCYGNAGEQKHCMSLAVAKAAVDAVVRNAAVTNSSKVAVSFHGGGEPTFGAAWTVLVDSVAYAKAKASDANLKLTTSIGTNGVLTESQLDWIVQNLDHVNLSFDGPEDIQNKQRPLSTGEGSYPHTLKTLRWFEDIDFAYDIRATITDESVLRMEEIVDFFSAICTRRSLHIEPADFCGRCLTSGGRGPEPQVFLKKYLAARAYAQHADKIDLSYASARVEKPTTHFCGAAGKNFSVTAQGDVTACHEVSLRSDPLKRIFFYGQYEEADQQFHFDMEKLSFLRRRTVHNLPGCSACFAKYGCAGDCLARVCRETGDIYDTTESSRCLINRGATLAKIQEKLNDSVQGESNEVE